MSAPLLEIADLRVRFGETFAVDGVSLKIEAGERVALVGESGSGKSVTALSILRLLHDAELSGSIRFDGQELLTKSEPAMRKLRGSDIAMIFQEPMTALNPLYTIGDQIVETIQLHDGVSARDARRRAIDLLARTGITEPEKRIDRYAHQLSGGQRQRAMIAMALACRPRLLLADEPTTALDVTIRAQIVELLLELQRDDAASRGMAVLLITHDLNLVRKFAQRVAVMEQGVLVEAARCRTYSRRRSIPIRCDCSRASRSARCCPCCRCRPYCSTRKRYPWNSPRRRLAWVAGSGAARSRRWIGYR